MKYRPLRTAILGMALALFVTGAGRDQPQQKTPGPVFIQRTSRWSAMPARRTFVWSPIGSNNFARCLACCFLTITMNSPVPTTVIVFKSDSSYKPFKVNPNVAGYFQPGEDVNYITLTTEKSSDDQPFRTIFHEYVHLLVENTMGATVPLWFNEGLAEYYSTFDIKDDYRRVILGDLIANHVLYLRENKFLPLRTLFAVDYKSPYYNEGNKMNVFYAESWMLMHYLLQGDGQKHRPQLAKFVDLLRANVTIDEAFQQAFQSSIDSLEKDFKSYVQGAKYMATGITFEHKLDFDSEMQSAPLAEAEAHAYSRRSVIAHATTCRRRGANSTGTRSESGFADGRSSVRHAARATGPPGRCATVSGKGSRGQLAKLSDPLLLRVRVQQFEYERISNRLELSA